VNPISYRLLLALAAYNDWEIDQWDIKSAYPNASLTETVYIEQPIGFNDNSNRVCRLNKALYGLKQSAREWEQHFKGLASKLDLKPLNTDQSVYITRDPAKILVLIVYVDDILAISDKKELIHDAYTALGKLGLIVKNLGPISTFLGIEITRDRPNRSIRLSQEAYIKKILNRFNKPIKDTKAISPIPLGVKLEPNPDTASPEEINQYQQEIGSINYLMTKTRPDLAYSIGLLSRFMANPSLLHRKALDHLWKYLGYTWNLGLLFHSSPNSLIGYTDADWGGDIGTRKSTIGYTFLFRGAAIAWNSRLQKTVALSSCEAEYMALKEAIKEQLYIKALLTEIPYFSVITDYSTLYTDSNSAIELAKNPLYHHRTKHIDIQYHFIREKIKDKLTNLIFIPTEKQLADGLTKPLDLIKTQALIRGLGLTNTQL
jgi:hypothetical protein